MKIIEATILFPMTIFIVVILIGFMMNLYDLLCIQIEEHEESITRIYSERVVKYINAYDKVEDFVFG